MKPLFGFVTLILLLCSSVIFGQSESAGAPGYPALSEVSYRYTGGSARAMGMGYAFVGLADDVSGGVWNPAGLWILEGPIISASYNMYSPGGEFSHSLSGVSKNELNLNALGHFSFVAPVRIKGHPWVFNFNFNRSNEFSDEFAYVRSTNSGLDPDSYLEDQGFLRAFNVGASTRIYKQLSFGFTLNVIDGRRITDQTLLSLFDIVIDPVYGTTAELFTSRRGIDSTTSKGFNFTLGTMYKAEKYSIGAVVHTPYTMQHSADISNYTTTTRNGLIDTDNTSSVFVVDDMTKQDIPLSFSFGVGLFPRENLTVAADLSYQNYGSTSWYYRTGMFFEPNGERTDFYEEFPIDWNNTIGIGLGMEYKLDSKFGQIPLRAGFRFDQSPQPETFNQKTSDVGYDDGNVPYQMPMFTTTREASGRQATTSFSLGTGITWSQIILDFAYMYTGGAKMQLTDATEAYYEDADGEPQVWTQDSTFEWEMKSHEFRITFTGLF